MFFGEDPKAPGIETELGSLYSGGLESSMLVIVSSFVDWVEVSLSLPCSSCFTASGRFVESG